MPRRPRWVLFGVAVALTLLQVVGVYVAAIGWTSFGLWLLLGLLVAVPSTRTWLGAGRIQLRWYLAALGLATGAGVTGWALHLMTSVPEDPLRLFWWCLVAAPATVALSCFLNNEKAAAWVVTHALGLTAVAWLVVGVYLVLVVGINGRPVGSERHVMLTSTLAAMVATVLAPLARSRVVAMVRDYLHVTAPTTGEAVQTFGARMSRAVPMDELMLQLAESLRETAPGSRSEIWTGSAALMTRTVSVPTRPTATLHFDPTEHTTITRARIAGPHWASVWTPALVPDEAHGDFRIVPVAHLGELLGLVCVYRPIETAAFTDEDEASLVELARQLGLALHNVNLDSALQESLVELAARNAELQASRLRIVGASDATRREIERNLHDGAQQHLVALAVKVGLVRAIAEDGDAETVSAMLGTLRDDVQVTIKEVRELAHGIYPPLLRDRGLGDALNAAATRSPLPCRVDVDLPGRYDQDVETAAYFCTLEAMQNAGKHAGEEAVITVTARAVDGRLRVELADDGAGFDPAAVQLSHGFVNMRDRLGALGGELEVCSEPGKGTRVTAVIPAEPLPPRVA